MAAVALGVLVVFGACTPAARVLTGEQTRVVDFVFDREVPADSVDVDLVVP
jgi:hypothetical protein